MAEELIYESLGGAGYQVARDYLKGALAKLNVDLGGIELSDIVGAALGFLGYSYLGGPMKTLARGVLVVAIANLAKDAVNAVKGSFQSASSGSSSVSSSSIGTRSYSGATEQYAIVRVMR